MVTGWRKTFCTSMPKANALTHKHDPNLTFYSNPSTPNSDSYSPKLECRTTCSLPNSPSQLQLTNNTTLTVAPSTFSYLLKSTLRLSKNRCGICTQGVKAGQGTAIFTAECSHTFHFPCIAAHVRMRQLLTCPVCSATWKQLTVADENTPPHHNQHAKTTLSVKLYNDDEPLASPTSVSAFVPIPESREENEDEENQVSTHFPGFHVSPSSPLKTRRTVEVCFSPEAAIVASNRSYDTYVAVLKVKAPACDSAAPRQPIDLVAVIDVGGVSSAEDLRALKRAMRVVISSLGSTDRLSVVAFSGGSKRLFPLRRIAGKGQRAARRVVDALAAVERSRGRAPARNDALKKAAKVLEDRREKNPVGKIVLISNDSEDRPLSVTSFSHLEIADRNCACWQDSALAQRVGNVLNLAAQDLKLELRVSSRSSPTEIAAVYSVSAGVLVLSPDSVVIGDLHAEEERELVVEFRVAAGTIARGTYHHIISVRCSHRDPFTQELVHSKERAVSVPRPHAVGSSDTTIERLRSLHISSRAVAESRQLSAKNDLAGAVRLLSSARALLIQPSRESNCPKDNEFLQWLEAEQGQLKRQIQSQKSCANNCLEEKLEPFTPMSAWRAAERLAKLAKMRKSMNRVSDLHGFENARF
ncbi:E3 ubiquitin-protein ligase WAVH1-like [Arachis stenosperma]|uniref:E3 ubiquitin-protein ligase WAVH1-like n=1 Tax=Arachis stenosperma TaxID=217475 RepID=UPI0025AD0C6C|nr:E3 ubiquitin-protein ligase WAVH1-like [Arachis stenosperma]